MVPILPSVAARCPWTSPWSSPLPPGPSGSGPGRGRATARNRRRDRCCSCTGCRPTPRLWDGVAAWLAEDGHPAVAVDLRGHGSSAEALDPTDGPGATLVAAADLAAVCVGLGWRSPIVVGQSWGGNVVLQLAADHPELVHGLALVDGGWLHLGDRWPTLDAAWVALAPPVLDGLSADDVRGRLRAAHPDWSDAAVEATVASLRVRADGTLTPGWSAAGTGGSCRACSSTGRGSCTRACGAALARRAGPERRRDRRVPLLDEAVGALPHAELVEFPGADHDLHAQHPERVAKLIGTL